MDEKTEDLRDIFMDVSETGTVTESQTDPRGTLADGDRDRDGDVGEVVAEMRSRYDFETDLSRDTYVSIVRAVHERDSDETIAAALGLDPETVFRARLDLHLLRESETDPPVDPSRLRADEDHSALAAESGVDEERLDRSRRVVAARDEARAANYHYREAFETILTDADVEGGYTDAAQEDGLREAAEDIETDVSF